jgi:hypothetical protein
MNELKDCPMCNSKATIDSTAVLEYSGKDWQTITVECSKEKCGMSLSLDMDFYYTNNGWQKMIDMWNSL